MALYQPTQIVPSTLSGLGDGVIDATEDLVVSWQINGMSAMTAYQIVIYQNDAVSTQMYDTGKVTLVDPVYGTDQNGNQILFEATAITAADLSTAGIVNGYANGYKFIITQWWGANSIAQTSASVFLTRAKPTITMGAIASPLASKELSVSATYTQAQGDSLSWVRWILTDYSGNVLKDTGRVSTGVLQFDYDGLFSGSSYYIECQIETENGVTATTGPVNFDVSYSMAPAEGLVDVCRRAGQPFVEVSWSDRSAVEGEPSGPYTVSGGLLKLPSGSSVTWDNVDGIPLSFAAPWSLAWRASLPTLPGASSFNSIISDIVPVQDLNGYDHPWPAGGGKNILDPNIKFTAGTYYGTTLTTSDGYTVTRSGQATGTGNIQTNHIALANAIILPAGTYTSTGPIFSLCKTDGSWLVNKSAGTWTVSESFYVESCYFTCTTGNTYSGTYFITLASGSTACSSWLPYSNLCPISGWTGANIYRTGKNLLSDGTTHKSGNSYFVGASSASEYPFFLKAGTYTASNEGTASYMYWQLKGTSINNVIHNGLTTVGTFTLLQDGWYRFWYYSTDADPSFTNSQLELGSPATAYEAYDGTTVTKDWTSTAGTVYGGSFNLTTGKLTDDSVKITLDSTIPSGTSGIRNITELSNCVRFEYYPYRSFGAAESAPLYSDMFANADTSSGDPWVANIGSGTSPRMYICVGKQYNTDALIRQWFTDNPTTFVCKVDSTTEYTLTGEDVSLLLGENFVYSDTGDTTISAYDNMGVLQTDGPDPIATLMGYSSTNIPVEIELEGGDDIDFVVSSGSFSIRKSGTPLMSQAVTFKPNDTLVVAMTPTEWYLKQVTYTGGLLPRPDLYPSSALYPTPVTKLINTWNGTLSYTQEDVTGITLNGEQTCEYLWLYRDAFSDGIIANLMGGEWYEPGFDANTLFLATFANNDLNADVAGGAGSVIYGMDIYRREGANPTLVRVADIEPGYTIFRDFGCKSNTQYTYYLYLKGQDTYVSAPIVSTIIRPGFNFYTLMECSQDSSDKNVYHVLQAFLVSGNLNAGAVSNGNNPNFLENFTRYPLRQAVPQNYKSGVLTTLIGAIDYGHNIYEDTWQLADRIQALSLSQNTLFLRDMKGALWMIHTNGPISMSVDDKSYAQPIQMSFPWAEIGNADEISIISTPMDDIWENDEIINTTVHLDEGTGILSWTRPDVYKGSILTLSEGGSLIAQGIGTVEIADMHIDEDANLIVTE